MEVGLEEKFEETNSKNPNEFSLSIFAWTRVKRKLRGLSAEEICIR
jgi:hypothetical protein